MEPQGQSHALGAVLCAGFAGFRVARTARSADKMVVSRRALKEQFSCLGVVASDEVLNKCEEICLANSVDEEELVEIWMAYSVSNLDGQDPTLETLAQMERKEFGKSIKEKPVSSKPHVSTHLMVYNNSVEDDTVDDDDILSSYNVTPKAKPRLGGAKNTTPDNTRSPRCVFSPASFSPTVATPSTKYGTRSNAGSMVCSFGDVEGASWECSCSFTPSIKVVSSVPAEACYMFTTLRERASLLDMSAEHLGLSIVAKAKLEEPQEVHGMYPEEFVTFGRVRAEAGKGRLRLGSVELEGTVELSAGRAVPLDLGGAVQYSLFPGQVVAVQACNPSRSTLQVRQVHCDAAKALPAQPPQLPPNAGPLHIVTASGPYTVSDTMTYQPLEDVLEYIKDKRPHVVVLMGPFIDCEHSLVKGGQLAETFDKFFEKQMDNMMNLLAGSNTQVVLVASSRDVHHHPVYPTPAYSLRRKHRSLHLMGDPCVLEVHGLTIAATATDVLKHLGNEELAGGQLAGDRLGRLASHLLKQQSLYPLYPASGHCSMDLRLWYDHAHLPFTPHLLLLPSDLRAFIKELSGCVVVNPERLTKGMVGGTFAHLVVNPAAKWSASCITGKVVKI